MDSKLEKNVMEKNSGFPQRKSSTHGACRYVYLKSTGGTRGYGFKNKWGGKKDPQYEYVLYLLNYLMYIYIYIHVSIRMIYIWMNCKCMMHHIASTVCILTVLGFVAFQIAPVTGLIKIPKRSKLIN